MKMGFYRATKVVLYRSFALNQLRTGWVHALVSLGFSIQFAPDLPAQSNQQLAGLSQDMQIMATKVNKMALQLSLLESRQTQLQQTLESYIAQQSELVREFNSLTVSLNVRLKGIEERESAVKASILAEVTAKMQVLANEMETAMATLAREVAAEPSAPSPAVEFSDDYPKTGVAYVVQPGDNLTKIAREQRSTVRDIQNANKIVNPRTDVQVGQTLFIPQKKP